MEEYDTKEKDVMKILVEVATAKREAEIVSSICVQEMGLIQGFFDFGGKGIFSGP